MTKRTWKDDARTGRKLNGGITRKVILRESEISHSRREP